MTVLDVRALVLAKAPVAGRVKTRLCPPYTPAQAATLAGAALADTLRAVARSAAGHRALVLDGLPELVMADGFEIIPQSPGGLDERIAAAFAAYGASRMAQILVGMDTPQLTASLLDQAMVTLLAPDVDAVIGPADDGGYWVVGVRCPNPDVFIGVPMSRPWTYCAQRARLKRLGLRVVTLPSLRDVDNALDAQAVADLAPSTAFAAALRAMEFERAALC